MADTHPKLRSLAVSDSGFIFDPANGQTFTTNEPGLAILALLKEGADLESIVARLEAEYDVDRELLYKDVVQFLNQMKTHRLIDEI